MYLCQGNEINSIVSAISATLKYSHWSLEICLRILLIRVFLLVTKMLQGGAGRFAPSFNMSNANQVHSFQLKFFLYNALFGRSGTIICLANKNAWRLPANFTKSIRDFTVKTPNWVTKTCTVLQSSASVYCRCYFEHG